MYSSTKSVAESKNIIAKRQILYCRVCKMDMLYKKDGVEKNKFLRPDYAHIIESYIKLGTRFYQASVYL